MIQLQQICAGYQERVVLDGLSLTLAPNRTTVVVGPGGSGKSTLLNLLGAATPAALWLRGDLHGVPSSSVALGQRSQLSPLATLREQFAPDPEGWLAQLWKGIPGPVELLRAALDSRPGTLSSGVRRLAEISAVLAESAELAILDEPDAGLHPDQREWLERLLSRLRGSRTIVLVTHYLPLAQRVSDEVVLLVDGAIVEAGATNRFFGRPSKLRTRQFIEMGC